MLRMYTIAMYFFLNTTLSFYITSVGNTGGRKPWQNIDTYNRILTLFEVTFWVNQNVPVSYFYGSCVNVGVLTFIWFCASSAIDTASL